MAEIDATAPVTLRSGQLPLEVRLRDDATLDNFMALAQAAPLLNSLQMQLQPGGEAVIYLYGSSGVGKSHVLQACCHADTARTLYLPLDELHQYPAEEVLQGVETLERVCLDNLQAALGNPDWELALFNLYNRAAQSGCKLVFAADAAPRTLAVELEDLRSRLSWAVVFQMVQGTDEDKAAILQFRATRRGMSLSAEAATFIVSRAPRAMSQLLSILDQLDDASLVQQRVLSIPFVKQTLGW